MMRGLRITALALIAVFAGFGLKTGGIQAAGGGQSPSQKPSEFLETESNLVLVDVIVTDKKGHYIRDLEKSDFRVYQDDKEQTITSFSRPSDAATSESARQRYVILFFDDSTISTAQQVPLRRAAVQFVNQSNSGNRWTAVVDFGGIMRVTQNFTDKADLLAHAVQQISFSAVQANVAEPSSEVASLSMSALGPPSIERASSDFAARSMLLSIRSLCQTLKAVPGRKTLILFSGGFPLTPEREAELSATIDAANKANVAIYPIDVRGLTNLMPNPFPETNPPLNSPMMPPGAQQQFHQFPHFENLLASLIAFPMPGQHGGGAGGAGSGSGGGGGRGGSGGGPGAGGSGAGGGGFGNPGSPGGPAPGSIGTGGGPRGGGNPGNTVGGFSNSPFNQRNYLNNQRPQILPPILESASNNQQVLYALATGTGGFKIFNTNDFLGGMNKIAEDLDEYYVIGYTPPNQRHDGSYHTIKVKVDHHDVEVRARNGYYDVKSPDLLAGTTEGANLAAAAASSQAGAIPVSMIAPYLYDSPNVARVQLAIEIPGSSMEFKKIKGKYKYQFNVLGIAYRADGSVAARFSDSAESGLEKKEEKEIGKSAFDYRNTFDIAPGSYKLTVVLSTGGDQFGKYTMPLSIAPYSGKKLTLSGLILSDRFQHASDLVATLDEKLLEGQLPLVAKDIQVTPSANNRFERKTEVGLYAEVYEPALENPGPLRVGVLYDIYDRQTKKDVLSSDTILVNEFEQAGNPVIPILVKVPVAKLPPGNYRIALRARDSMGNASQLQNADFSVE